MEEKLYLFNENDDEEIIDEQIREFFEDIIDRKPIIEEEGLHANMVILEDRAGAKICENNGRAPRVQSVANLVKVLRGKDDYISLEDISNKQLYKDEQMDLLLHGVEGIIYSNDEELIVALHGSRHLELTDFQKDAIKRIVERCRRIREDNEYKYVELGLYSGENIFIDIDSLTDDLIKEIDDSLGSKQMTLKQSNN